MKSTNRYIILSATIIVAIIASIATYQAFRHYRYTRLNLESHDGQAHGYYIYPSASTDSVLALIRTDYSVISEHALRKDMERTGLHTPEPGYFRFPEKMGNRTLMLTLRNGKQTPVRLQFTTNIRTNAQLAGRLAQQLLTDSASIIALLDSNDYLAQYQMNKETARCLFLPDTYEVYWTMTAEQLIQRMAREYNKFWTAQRREQAQALGLTPQQVYILASIVASETNNGFEYPIIAGLYLNRIRIGMPMQACPTAVYATGKFGARRISYDMISFPSPYNTYLHTGLPPGPIRVTRATVIDSTLHATPSKYLYMCANPDFSGTHVFSESYSKHCAVAQKYQRELNKRKIRH